MKKVVGVDEAGRGPLAGPVVAAACYLPPRFPLQGIYDSKQMTPSEREALFLRLQGVPHGIGVATVEEIEEINILEATFLAMQRAVEALPFVPDRVLVDGNLLPSWPYEAEAIVRGDETVPSISAASILAKVTRDAMARQWDLLYPGYFFAQHKGYGTPLHRQMIREKGATKIHRKKFIEGKTWS